MFWDVLFWQHNLCQRDYNRVRQELDDAMGPGKKRMNVGVRSEFIVQSRISPSVTLSTRTSSSVRHAHKHSTELHSARFCLERGSCILFLPHPVPPDYFYSSDLAFGEYENGIT